MLTILRAAAGSWVAKVLLALLVASFAVFGISASSFNFASNSLANVGEEKISVVDFQRSYIRQVNNLSQQFGQRITMQQAQQFGIPAQVLNQLVTEAAINTRTNDMGMGVSDEQLRTEILSNPAFRDTSGEFDRLAFNAALANAGVSENEFIAAQRDAVVRDQLLNTLQANVGASNVMQNLLGDYLSEERTFDYIQLNSSNIDPVADPSDSELQTYFDDNKVDFARPEYRTGRFFVLEAADIVSPNDISTDDAKQYYEDNIDSYKSAEKRTIERIRYDNRGDAEAAVAKAKSGATFETLVTDKGLQPNEVELGTLDKDGILDKKLRDAVFALEQGIVSDVIEGDFGLFVARVSNIEAEQTQPFDQVEGAIKARIAADQGVDRLQETYDEIEDERGAGSSFDEIAGKFSLFLQEVNGTARDGKLADGGELPLTTPSRTELLAGLFEAEVGDETDPLDVGRDGYMWFELTDIEEARDTELSEVRDDVVEVWKLRESALAVEAKAREIADQVKSGRTLSEFAETLSVEVVADQKTTRRGRDQSLNTTIIDAIFAGPSDHVEIIDNGEPGTWLIFQVKGVTQKDAADTGNAMTQLNDGIQNDLFDAYVRQVQETAGINVNPTAVTGALEALNAHGGGHGG